METGHKFIREGLHLGLEIAKITLKAGAVVAAILTVCEIHKIHQSLEKHHLLK